MHFSCAVHVIAIKYHIRSFKCKFAYAIVSQINAAIHMQGIVTQLIGEDRIRSLNYSKNLHEGKAE